MEVEQEELRGAGLLVSILLPAWCYMVLYLCILQWERANEVMLSGQYGDGNLSPKIGVGEYLDKLAIEKAKVRAMALGGRTRNRLSIRTLTLTGFVVDADAFLHWFDPARLRCIHFRNDCVDAGFYLSLPMKKVSILFPREIEEKFVAGRRVDLVSELKVVRLLNGKKVEEIPYRQGLTGICQGRKAMIL